jgi:hypothetical protein
METNIHHGMAKIKLIKLPTIKKMLVEFCFLRKALSLRKKIISTKMQPFRSSSVDLGTLLVVGS